MTDRARDVLNALLGVDRDTYKSSYVPAKENVCIYMLASFCPFMLFQNTKGSIGRCRYANHEEYYRIEYIRRGGVAEAHEWDLLRLLVEIVLKIQKNSKCVVRVDDGSELLDKITDQEEVFRQKLDAIGALGMAGSVEEAFSAVTECERIKERLEKSKEAYYVRNNGVGMEGCKVCGANITLSDTEPKINKHLNGKLHRGHMIVRRKLSELLKKFKISSITEIFPQGVTFKYIKDHQ